MRYFMVAPASWRSMTKFRASCAVQIAVGVRGGAENTDAAGGVFDDGDVQPCSGQRPGFEEVGGEDRVSLAAQERGPGLAASVRHGIDAVVVEDFPDCRRGDVDAEGGEFAVDAPVAPACV